MLYMSLQHTTSLSWLDICYVASKQVATAGLAPASLRQLIWTRLGAVGVLTNFSDEAVNGWRKEYV